eukprot:TRINITY_DN2667_c0_g1_i1.p1 TRINITY_DN2667_c0_g1~~TRINITY_DN2667_c0_g1_i1.p1  ORF type:complete len:287 (+),score=45.94 TRINITY_DN2667_c0_g1_i1:34-861(+)
MTEEYGRLSSRDSRGSQDSEDNDQIEETSHSNVSNISSPPQPIPFQARPTTTPTVYDVLHSLEDPLLRLERNARTWKIWLTFLEIIQVLFSLLLLKEFPMLLGLFGSVSLIGILGCYLQNPTHQKSFLFAYIICKGLILIFPIWSLFEVLRDTTRDEPRIWVLLSLVVASVQVLCLYLANFIIKSHHERARLTELQEMQVREPSNESLQVVTSVFVIPSPVQASSYTPYTFGSPDTINNQPPLQPPSYAVLPQLSSPTSADNSQVNSNSSSDVRV